MTEFEFPTDSYDDLSVFLGYATAFGDTDIDVFLQGRNLTDDEQRNHSSFIKDFAPRPGLTWEAGIRLNF